MQYWILRSKRLCSVQDRLRSWSRLCWFPLIYKVTCPKDRTKYRLDQISKSNMKLLQFPNLNLDTTKSYLHNISTNGLFNSLTFCVNDSDPSLFIVIGLWCLSTLAILLVFCTYSKMCQAKSDVSTRPQGRRSLCEQVLADNNLPPPAILQ